MNILLLSAILTSSGLLGILLDVAIGAIVLWAIIALIQWSGIVIPPPVRIIAIALVCIVLVIFLFRLAGFAL